jgi:uncharacterized protein
MIHMAVIPGRAARASETHRTPRLRRPGRNDAAVVQYARGFLALSLLLFALAIPALAAPKFPALTGRVVDEAQILSPQTEAMLTQKSADLEAQTHHQFVVVTLKDLQGYDIADYGYQLGRAWGIGGKAENDGVLLIVAPGEHKVRIEVGYGLEPVLTDALSSVILQTQVLPKFRAGDMEGGVVAGADAIVTQLGLDPAAQQKAVEAAAQKQEDKGGFPFWILAFIAFWVLFGAARRGRRGGGLGAALPWIILGGMAGSGRRSSGWSSGGGGGGFSGGGGSFGGGGSSGSW